jgi:hypothetical protein
MSISVGPSYQNVVIPRRVPPVQRPFDDLRIPYKHPEQEDMSRKRTMANKRVVLYEALQALLSEGGFLDSLVKQLGASASPQFLRRVQILKHAIIALDKKHADVRLHTFLREELDLYSLVKDTRKTFLQSGEIDNSTPHLGNTIFACETVERAVETMFVY